MSVQLLISALECDNYTEFLSHMRVDSDAIIVNQCNKNSVNGFEYQGNNIKVYECSERGIGKSRNTAIIKADADYCLFTDDDMIYCENYKEIVRKAFEDNKKADIIIFNLERKGKIVKSKKKHWVRWYNYMRHGMAGIAVRRESIIKKSVFFNLLFGGGAVYGCGEDTLFLTECLRKKLKILFLPIKIAALDDRRESTWFKGYNEKYFFDKGCLYSAIAGKYARLLCTIMILKNKRMTEKIGFLKALRTGLKGVGVFSKSKRVVKYEEI